MEKMKIKDLSNLVDVLRDLAELEKELGVDIPVTITIEIGLPNMEGLKRG